MKEPIRTYSGFENEDERLLKIYEINMEEYRKHQANPIQIDDQVKAVDNAPLYGKKIAPPLVVGETYTVKDIIECQCGRKHIDVGLVSKYQFVSCHACGQELPGGDKIHWCYPLRLVKI